MHGEDLRAEINFRLEKFDLATGLVSFEEVHNLSVDAGLVLIAGALNGEGSTLTIAYVALGTSGTAPAAGNTTLGTETYRDVPTQLTRSSKTVTIKLYLSSSQGNGNTFQESGLFIGGTSSANTGTLLARVTYTADAKTSAQSWTITWTVTLS